MSLKLIGNITIFLSNNYVSLKKKIQHHEYHHIYFSTTALCGLFFLAFQTRFFRKWGSFYLIFCTRKPRSIKLQRRLLLHPKSRYCIVQATALGQRSTHRPYPPYHPLEDDGRWLGRNAQPFFNREHNKKEGSQLLEHVFKKNSPACLLCHDIAVCRATGSRICSSVAAGIGIVV